MGKLLRKEHESELRKYRRINLYDRLERIAYGMNDGGVRVRTGALHVNPYHWMSVHGGFKRRRIERLCDLSFLCGLAQECYHPIFHELQLSVEVLGNEIFGIPFYEWEYSAFCKTLILEKMAMPVCVGESNEGVNRLMALYQTKQIHAFANKILTYTYLRGGGCFESYIMHDELAFVQYAQHYLLLCLRDLSQSEPRT